MVEGVGEIAFWKGHFIFVHIMGMNGFDGAG